MTEKEHGAGPEAQRSADRLAVALEEIGFDVGREFPALHSDIGREALPIIRLGDIKPATADRLVTVLTRAAEFGVRVDETR